MLIVKTAVIKLKRFLPNYCYYMSFVVGVFKKNTIFAFQTRRIFLTS